jgi:hypothetical protein
LPRALHVLYRAVLIRANLNGVNLRGATLRGATLRGADLRDAILVGADLRGVTLRDARYGCADLTGAKWSKGAPVPEGWNLGTGSDRLERQANGTPASRASGGELTAAWTPDMRGRLLPGFRS